MQDQNNLQVYQEAYQFGLRVYNINYPEFEKFGLRDQLRRAAISISLNLAEGCGRQSDKDFLRFLYISYGSIKESETLLDFSRDLNYISQAEYLVLRDQLGNIAKKLNNLIKSVRN